MLTAGSVLDQPYILFLLPQSNCPKSRWIKESRKRCEQNRTAVLP